MLYFIIKYISIHHMCTYFNCFCNYTMTIYVINLMVNHVLPHGNTFVILPTNDHMHKKVPCASTIIVRLGFHILPLILLFLQLWNSYICIWQIIQWPIWSHVALRCRLCHMALMFRLCHVAHKLSLGLVM